jgi:eukaryotic-like serine/threonine-protein kinase
MRPIALAIVISFLGSVGMTIGAPVPAVPVVGAADLAGVWSGTVSHAGEATALSLELEPLNGGELAIKLTIPAIHLVSVPIAQAVPRVEGDQIRLGPFAFTFDRTAGVLRGTVPEALAPIYRLPLELRRGERLEVALRGGVEVAATQPAWKLDTGAPLWPGCTFFDGVVLAGGDDGRLHAVDARTGTERWSFVAGGAIRTRAVGAGGAVYFQADDGFCYALDSTTGKLRWKVKVVPAKILRLPSSDPATRHDRLGSDVAVVGERLYLGTHDGKVLCLAASTGAAIWEHATGGSVLAAPTVSGGRVYVGSYDGSVYALDAAKGRLLWQHDTGKPVVSTPAVAGKVVVVGSRSYDLLGLDGATGKTVWTRYLWFSWIDSSAVVDGGVAFVGSSDAAVLLAFDPATGRQIWAADVWGWAWGQPALAARRVYIGTAAQRGYPAVQRGQAVAVDRDTGQIAWRFAPAPPEEGVYGFVGSPAVGAGLVYFASLDGAVYAFAE